MIILETRDLTRKFGDFTAVDKLNISIEQGEIFALLGPNGAGKTTAIKMLTTLLPVSSGTAVINGFDITHQSAKVRANIGYVPQMLSVDGSLTGYENLLLFAKLYDIPRTERRKRIEDALDFMNLKEAAQKQVHEFSGGMIRRLEIAQSMMHHPPVLFLDEPTVGLDPIARNSVWTHILELQKTYGTTILLTTHLMEEADELCNRIAFLSQGKLAAVGSPTELKDSMPDKNATLEDVFIHYASESLDGGTTAGYRSIGRERRTAARIG
jgi:ABC-2 type transport system ATP-binding protein